MPRALGKTSVDLSFSSPSTQVRSLKDCDLVLATPYLIERLAGYDLRCSVSASLVTSGARADQKTWRAAERLGFSRVLDIFGSSETGGLGVRASATAAFSLLPHLKRSSASVKIRKGGSLPLQDRLEWVADDKFHVSGRLDDTVQVAGTNVSIAGVRDTFMTSDLVSDIAVRHDGSAIRAFVVPSDGKTEEDVRIDLNRLALTLPAPARPAVWCIGKEIPRSASGKLIDWS